MTRHTPGPWVMDWGRGQEVRIDAPSGDPTLGYKAWRGLASAWGCEDNPVTGMEVAVANARLIAAAPELLELLEAIVGIPPHEDCPFSSHDCDCGVEEQEMRVIRKARTILMRVKGEG